MLHLLHGALIYFLRFLIDPIGFHSFPLISIHLILTDGGGAGDLQGPRERRLLAKHIPKRAHSALGPGMM